MSDGALVPFNFAEDDTEAERLRIVVEFPGADFFVKICANRPLAHEQVAAGSQRSYTLNDNVALALLTVPGLVHGSILNRIGEYEVTYERNLAFSDARICRDTIRALIQAFDVKPEEVDAFTLNKRPQNPQAWR